MASRMLNTFILLTGLPSLSKAVRILSFICLYLGRAVIELMYADFIGRAGDEIFNQMSKYTARHPRSKW